jgi:hypothetical protein
MPKLNTNLAGAAQITRQADQFFVLEKIGLKKGITADKARELLRDFRAGLVGEDGSVSSGYLSINRKFGGGMAMETRGRHEWGSWHSNKKDAAHLIRQLISTGYGKELSAQTKKLLNEELQSYLGQTKDRFGTQSFVRLVDKLENELNPDKVDLPAPATIAAKTSFKAGFHIVSRATEDAIKRAGDLKAKFKTVEQLGKCSPEAKPAFEKIVKHASEDAVTHFNNLLAPPKKAGAASNVQAVSMQTQVVGDADGSICRTVLAGINAGYMTLPDDQLQELAEMMNKEAEVANDKMTAKSFQEDKSIASKFDRIVANATFQQGHSKLVFLGDIVHDRFSNNKQAMAKLIQGLHGAGAVFITGNHDVYSEVDSKDQFQKSDEELISLWKSKNRNEPDIAKSLKVKLLNGFYGENQLTKTESDDLLKKCFVNAHLDPDSSMLYTHNGLQQAGKDGVYITAFGLIEAQNAEELVAKLNQCEFDKPIETEEIENKHSEVEGFMNSLTKGKETQKWFSDTYTISKTGFRPKDSEMQTDKLGLAGRTADGKAVRIVHGHDENHGEQGNVVNLNARSESKGYDPATKIFE